MGDLIGQSRFNPIPEDRKNDFTLDLDEIIESGELGDNIIIFEEGRSIEDDINDFKDLIVEAIDHIIDLGMEDFKMHAGNNKYGNLYEDTTDIWNEMFIKSVGIEEGFNYMQNEDDFPFELDPSYYIQAIGDILSPYQKTVFNELKNKYKTKEN